MHTHIYNILRRQIEPCDSLSGILVKINCGKIFLIYILCEFALVFFPHLARLLKFYFDRGSFQVLLLRTLLQDILQLMSWALIVGVVEVHVQ
jgi:hypothetical protein